jgi:hypothetical protein
MGSDKSMAASREVKNADSRVPNSDRILGITKSCHFFSVKRKHPSEGNHKPACWRLWRTCAKEDGSGKVDNYSIINVTF